jgi:hypothetical protein
MLDSFADGDALKAKTGVCFVHCPDFELHGLEMFE